MEFKLNIADPKQKKCMQKAIAEPAADNFIGLKIGDKVKGDSFDLKGYELEITGGSDLAGFPMRKGIITPRKKILAERGSGFRKYVKGLKTRKTVCGETITNRIVQINLRVAKEGEKPIVFEEKKKEGKAEEKKE